MLPEEVSKRGDKSWPRNLGGSFREGHRAIGSSAGRIYSNQAAKAAAGIGVLAICAAVFYRVRELLAALILFSAVFAVVIVAALILWMVGQASHEAVVRLETHMERKPSRHIVAAFRTHAGHILRSPPWN